LKTSSKHGKEFEGALTNLLGGLNYALPPFAIADDDLVDATNFYYDPTSGYLTTRPGLKRYSTGTAGYGVNGIYGFTKAGVTTVVFTTEEEKLYKLDGSLAPSLIGTLSGSKRPSFSTLSSKLVTASGGVLQTWDGTTFSNTTSPAMDFISDHSKENASRIVGVGNTTYRDRLFLGGINDPANWTFNASPETDAKYIDCGYNDGTDATGLGVYLGQVCVFKHSADMGDKNIYRARVNLASPYWTCPRISQRVNGSLSPHFIKELTGMSGTKLVFVDTEGAKTMQAVESTDDLPFPVSLSGIKIAPALRPYVSGDGFSIYDQKLGALLIKPSKNSEVFYVMDVVNERWTIFRYSLNILSGAYIGGKMLFGASDGYIYEYDFTSDQDNGIPYTKTVESKWFNIDPMRRELSKEKEVDIVGLSEGTISFSVKNRGALVGEAKTFSFTQGWWDWAIVNAVTPENWTEPLNKTAYQTLRNTDRVAGDFISFQLSVTSGLCYVAQVRARIADVGRNI
jgi:hypothetical protein